MKKEKTPSSLDVARKKLDQAVDRHTNKALQLAAIREVERRMWAHCEKLEAEVKRLEKEMVDSSVE